MKARMTLFVMLVHDNNHHTAKLCFLFICSLIIHVMNEHVRRKEREHFNSLGMFMIKYRHCDSFSFLL